MTQTFCSPRMLAELFDVSPETIRNWYKRGLLVPVCIEKGIPCFDATGVLSAQCLAELKKAGLRADVIERIVKNLQKMGPEGLALFSCRNILIRGKQVFFRKDGRLLEASGQEVFRFLETLEPTDESPVAPSTADSETHGAPLENILELIFDSREASSPNVSVEALRRTADFFETENQWALAEEIRRNVLFMDEHEGMDVFFLGRALYHQENLAGAKERLSQAVEQNPHFPEAYQLLSQVLEELGEEELSQAAQ